MKPADSFDGDNLPASNGTGCFDDGCRGGVETRPYQDIPFVIPQFQTRPADRAGVGLGVKTPVHRVVIFSLAEITHREFLHRRIAAVIGNRFYNAKARPTMGAIREWVKIAAIARAEEIYQTIRAGGDIRKNPGCFL